MATCSVQLGFGLVAGFFSNNPGILLEISIDNLALLYSFFVFLRNEGTTANFISSLVGKQYSPLLRGKKKKA